MPQAMLSDTACGSDDNVQACEQKDVEFVSQTLEKKPDDMDATHSDDFVVNELTGEVECCPRGEKPLKSYCGSLNGIQHDA